MESGGAEYVEPQTTDEQQATTPGAAAIDEAEVDELMVKVAEEDIICDHCHVDYDPFLRMPDEVADSGSGVRQHPKDKLPAAEGAHVKLFPDSDEPEWIFIGGSQPHRVSSTNISAETSHFIMKRSSVTKMKEVNDISPMPAGAAVVSGEST